MRRYFVQHFGSSVPRQCAAVASAQARATMMQPATPVALRMKTKLPPGQPLAAVARVAAANAAEVRSGAICSTICQEAMPQARIERCVGVALLPLARAATELRGVLVAAAAGTALAAAAAAA